MGLVWGQKCFEAQRRWKDKGDRRIPRRLVDGDITLMMRLRECSGVKGGMGSWMNTVKEMSHWANG